MELSPSSPHSDSSPKILTTGEASRALGMSPDRVRQLERCGVLPAIRTETGVRLFERATIEQFQRTRAGKTRWRARQK
ncbi:MerR family DNA-binding transcriptional regulator [Nitrospira moscoviensis]|uniref:MerR family DNA-binding transcriptional regulator n=1 Tax=Nitrospira moscoviensis TaxID=42253 RepID=UPI0009F96F54